MMIEVLIVNSGTPPPTLPETLRPLFWDVDFDRLDWHEDRPLITSRILRHGPWGAVAWLRSQIGDRVLGQFILGHQGRGLSRQQLRFWELVLELPADEVDSWLRERAADPWDRRHAS